MSPLYPCLDQFGHTKQKFACRYFPRCLRLVNGPIASDEVCSDFTCPDNYSLVDDPESIVCKGSECTKSECCVRDSETTVRIFPC